MHTTRWLLAIPVALALTSTLSRAESVLSADTTMFHGVGLNKLSWPIDVPVTGGVRRKLPGERSWRFVPGMTSEQLKAYRLSARQRALSTHGDEKREIIIDSLDPRAESVLHTLGIVTPTRSSPMEIRYRDLDVLRREGIAYRAAASPRTATPSKEHVLTGDAASETSTSRMPITDSETVVFEDTFERATLGADWLAGDLDTANPWGSDYWGIRATPCTYAHGGSRALDCAGVSDQPCLQYDDDMNAYCDNSSPFNTAAFATIDISLWTKHNTEQGLDLFEWSYWTPASGWVLGAQLSGAGDWTLRGVTIVNDNHAADQVQLGLSFFTDFTIHSEGVQVDDIIIRGNQPNLRPHIPLGASGPIVPAATSGTSTGSILYAHPEFTYIDWHIANTGTADAVASFYIDYYIDGAFIHSVTVFGLSQGSPFSDPDWAYAVGGAGSHTLRMVIDPTNLVAESNEADNDTTLSFVWQPARQPDLRIQGMVPSTATPTVGQAIDVFIILRNVGAGPAAGSFSTYFYKNLSSPPTQGQLPNDHVHVTFNLAAGEQSVYTINNLTSSSPGTWTMYAYVDATNIINTESNEDNNASSGVGVTWSPPPPPDLVIESVLASNGSPMVGSTISAIITLKNEGMGAAGGPFAIRFYKNLGSPPTLGQTSPPADDTHTIASLGAGLSASYTVHGLSSQTGTSWTMYAYVDDPDVVVESTETNNASTGAVVNWQSGFITVSGTIAYDDTSYTGAPGSTTGRPCKCIEISLYDADAPTQGDPLNDILATTYTNDNGQFAFPAIENRDADVDQGRLDVFVVVTLRNGVPCRPDQAVTVTDDSTPSKPWAFPSLIVTDATNGALGTIKPSSYEVRSALNIYHAILNGYDAARSIGASPHREWAIEARWNVGYAAPTGYSVGLLNVSGVRDAALGYPDEWDGAVLLHEYGHHLEYVFDFGDESVTCPHSWTSRAECPPGRPSPQLAFKEGWGHFFGTRHQWPPRLGTSGPSPVGRDVGVDPDNETQRVVLRDLELGVLYVDGVPVDTVNARPMGWLWEAPIGATLWDLIDFPDDNENGDACEDVAGGVNSLQQVMDVILNHGVHPLNTMDDFYALYCERYLSGDPGLKAAADLAFCEHGMEVASCHLAEVSPGGPLLEVLRAVPNPSRGQVAFEFAVQQRERGALRVYDACGRMVRTILDEMVERGPHRVIWNGEDSIGRRAAPGIYFCSLRTKDRVMRRTVLLLE